VNAAAGRIGPNAITRVGEVLRLRMGDAATASLFGLAGMADYLVQPPQQMVDEAEVTRLHRALRESIGTSAADAIAREAGTRTGDYLLAHRIQRGCCSQPSVGMPGPLRAAASSRPRRAGPWC